MGKSAKKKAVPKAFDARGVATVSIPKAKKEEEPPEQTEAPGEGAAETSSPAAASVPAVEAASSSAAPAEQTAAATEPPDVEEWELAAEKVGQPSTMNGAAQSKSGAASPSQAEVVADAAAAALDEEQWEKAVESRLEEELSKVVGKRVVPVDTSAQLERKGGQPPAGVVVLNKTAEQKVSQAIEHLRSGEEDETGMRPLRMIFPKSWRYKGKLTFERLNSIYLGLESLKFQPSQIKWAMTATLGHEFRAAIEFLLLNCPKEQLPRQLGGEGSLEDGEDIEASKLEGADAAADAKATETPAEGPVADSNGAKTGASQDTPGLKEEAAADIAAKEAEQEDEKAKPQAPENGAADGKDFTKQWLEKYCEGDDSDSDGLLSPEERLEKERFNDPTARYIKVMKQHEEASRVAKAAKDKMKQHASQKKNVSSDMQKQKEATERMRTLKHEMEALESGKYGKLKQAEIAQHRSAAAKSSKPPTKSEAAAPAAGKEDKDAASAATAAAEEEEDEEVELPQLFEDSTAGGETETAAPASEPTRKVKPLRSYKLTGWGGRTPKQVLEEFVNKHILAKPAKGGPVVTYVKTKEPSGYFVAEAVVKQPRGLPPQPFNPHEVCETAQEAEQLAAAFAIYKLAQDVDRPGMCRGLPPAFRDRVKEWEQEAEEKLKAIQRQHVKTRIEFIGGLMKTGAPASAPAAFADDCAVQEVTSPHAEDDGGGFADLSSSTSDKLRADWRARQTRLGSNSEWRSIQEARAQLPVADHRDRLLAMIRGSGVSIVSGATGSGKTTQVPQFVLEAALEGDDGEALPNIVVTEPRRISATSVARRVSKELGDPADGPGGRHSLVGYQIRLERRATENTRLLFCTVGVLLRRLQLGRGSITGVTHIFVDEVHERSAECDLLMLLLKQLRTTRSDIRVILMSATMDSDKLRAYFGGSGVPAEVVPGRTFPVQDFWLEDVVEMTGYYCEEDGEFAKRGWKAATKVSYQVSAGGGRTQQIVDFVDEDEDEAYQEVEGCDEQQYSPDTQRTLLRMDHTRINFDLIELLLECIEDAPQFQDIPRHDGAVLIFLPGLMEITKLNDRLLRTKLFGDSSRCSVISLHSVLSGEDQAKAFDRPPRGVRKVVLSTNIAETGVTIPDVVYVIDAGKVKSQFYHEASNTSSLKERFISCAEVMQRRGRAGRVREGICFHLMTRRRFQKRLQPLPVPEILRCSLMELALSVLTSGMQPGCFLHALDPPPKGRIDQAIATLRATGAVEDIPRPSNMPLIGAFDDAYYAVTPLGQCLARLPCDVRLGKMVLLAALFGGLEPVWTIAATLSHRTPLVTPFSESKRQQARQTHVAHFLPAKEPPSDHTALSTAYGQWDENRRNKHAESFCRKTYLSNSVLLAIADIRRDLVDTVEGDGFCEKFGKDEVPVAEAKSPQMIAALLFAGLYPNVARVDAPKSAAEQHPVLSAGSELLKVHPGSLCHGRTEGLHRTNCRWICYHERVKTWQTFLRDCSFLPPTALLLFGGDPSSICIHPLEKSVSLGVGGDRQWQAFHIAPRSAAMIRQLRYAFDSMLRRKASNPKQPLSEKDRKIVLAYIAVINSLAPAS